MTKKPTAAAAPDEHSSLVGGSTAAQRLACPGSWSLEQKLPASAFKKSSKEADEGSACHACMSYALAEGIIDPEELLGMAFKGGDDEWVMTRELIDDCIAPAMAFIDKLMEEYPDLEFEVETRMEMPGIPDQFGKTGASFGTGDFLARSPAARVAIVLDYKFGSGVTVKAVYEREDEEGPYEVPNAQLMYYGRSAMHTKPELFEEVDKVRLIILQPRSRDKADDDPYGVSETTTDKAELEQFRMALVRAIAEAVGKNPTINRGEHCRFAKCKVICPAHLEPTLDLTKAVNAIQERRQTPLGSVFDYGDIYAALLDLMAIWEPLVKEAKEQAHAFMEAGGEVPDWKLVDKRSAGRVWVKDDAKVIEKLKAMGVPEMDYQETKLRSPPQVETAIKKRGLALPDGYFDKKPSSGTTVAPIDDKRLEAIPPGQIVKNFQAKLLALKPAE